ncbi:MAG TPA: endonuclease MutS2, partial [Candidatus Limnocylindrales bacterium]|nr:endonuclease MutS2 [Candidatus Limnocylindrales bacterium]
MTDQRSQDLLEFPSIRARLAEHTAFGPSRRLAEALTPSSDPIVVKRLLDETDEARDVAARRPDIGVGGARDIGQLILRARRRGRLSGSELLEILDTLVAAGRVADALRNEKLPLIHELSRSIKTLPQLRGRLELSLDPAGELLDSASPALGGLRRAVRVAYERLRTKLESLVHGSELSSALQEPLVTLRNGRYVIPVRADQRGRVKGIVHDQSGSGQTVFIEPLVVVELGNAWREAQLAVESEEERILDELSALVDAQADPLEDTLAALATFDFWIARSRLSSELNGVRPDSSASGRVELLSARHPGLTGRVVPIDIRLGDTFRALIITGPNTGGKTVALRTLGLLALMHQSGLHVPAAPGSRLPVFRDVFADIGDEQSIAQSLSTFSGHMRSIVRIVDAAGPDCLVLLDELGAGTDPTEGSALAQALLDHFIRAGALIVATTHYAELKTYAHNTPEASNASVEFDLETLSPTYRLQIGLPGTSHAFAIATRLGLPDGLVADARERLGRAQQEFEETLVSIKEAQITAEEALARASDSEERARNARREAEEERRSARREREAALANARTEAEKALAEVQSEIAAARDLLTRATLTESRLEESAERLRGTVGSLGGDEPEVDEPLSPGSASSVHVGARVRTAAGWEGTVAEVDAEKGTATIAAGSMRINAALVELVAVAPAPQGGRRGDLGTSPGTVAQRPVMRAVPSSLDVRGARVEEAREMLDSYLDGAAVAGAPRVTIIHGHGSGALRDALRAQLSGHPLIKS